MQPIRSAEASAPRPDALRSPGTFAAALRRRGAQAPRGGAGPTRPPSAAGTRALGDGARGPLSPRAASALASKTHGAGALTSRCGPGATLEEKRLVAEQLLRAALGEREEPKGGIEVRDEHVSTLVGESQRASESQHAGPVLGTAAVIERIETFLKSEYPALQLNLGGRLGAVRVTRLGAGKVSIGFGGSTPPEAAELTRLVDRLAARGIEAEIRRGR